MATFEEFYKSIETDKSGKRFEKFVKWFLKNEPMWKLIVDEIWLWDEYPDRWSRDKGIDLVFKDKQAGIWAVQAKQYDSNTYISKPDVDSFLSESGKQNIKGRLLIASTNAIGANAMEVITNENTFPPVTTFLLSNFKKAYDDGFEYPESPSTFTKSKIRKVVDNNRKYQIKAVKDVTKNFHVSNRGKLIMACGTGKTLVTLFIMESMNSNFTLVLLPSLLLVSNTLRTWTNFSKTKFEFLCVCSDQQITKNNIQENEDDITTSEIPLVTSNVSEIKNFMLSKGKKVIFSTYQSSHLIAQVQKNKKVSTFDLLIADEAHRTAVTSLKKNNYIDILDNTFIRSKKRLFTTATPRVFSSLVKKTALSKNMHVSDMNDKKLYGSTFFEYTFGQAIKEKYLSDYQVIIVTVNSKEYIEKIEKRVLISTKNKKITDLKSYSLQVSLLKAIKKYKIKKLISFHNRVENAKKFSDEIKETSEDIKIKYQFGTSHLNGKMKTFQREQELDRLENLNCEDYLMISNARCLSEGIDIPSLDGVVFVDPRKSEIDIIQIVGRAIRKSKDKTKGTIVLPVFIEKNKNGETEIEKSSFKSIWKILNALKSHDKNLEEEINQIRRGLGRTGVKYIKKPLPKIIFDLPLDLDKNFIKSLSTRIIETTSENWFFMYGILEKLLIDDKNKNIPHDLNFNGYKVGYWVNTQRTYYKDKKLPIHKIKLLESLDGWVWDDLERMWDEGFHYLMIFFKREGHATVKTDHVEEGYQLGNWVNNQRQNFNKNKIHKIKIKILNDLNGWVWSPHDAAWQEGYNHLLKYVKREGNGNVLLSHIEDTFALGKWVNYQRQSYRYRNNKKFKKNISKDRIDKLNSINGWIWDPLEARWQLGYSYLMKFYDREKHALVPDAYIEDGFKLGNWVKSQRQNYKKKTKTLNNEKIKLLNKLKNWDWDPSETRWQLGYSCLLKFYNREKHALVPGSHIEDGFKLGNWVSRQRQGYKNRKNKNSEKTISKDRIDKLNAINGWVWEV